MCPCSLDQKNTGIDVAMEFSRSARAELTPSPSKLNSVRIAYIEVDVIPGELTSWTTIDPKTNIVIKQEPAPTGVIAPASLERR